MGCLNGGQSSRGYSKNQLLQVGGRKIIKQSKIAEGAYGQIWKCLQPLTSQIFALKFIRIQNKQLMKMFQKQIDALVNFILQKTQMRNERSKNVVQIIQSAKYILPQYKICCILLQFSHMSLYQQIQNRRFTNQQIINILLQILNGLKQLHMANIYHLDIKPQNIIFCKNQYKICDLGSSIRGKIDFRQMPREKIHQFQQYIQSNSTLIYRAPQMIDTTGKVLDAKTDLWMVGLIAYIMLYRKHPFQNQGKLAILCPVNFPTSGQLQSIIQKMLTIDCFTRISTKDARKALKRLINQRDQQQID